MKLKAYQEELKELLFFRPAAPATSRLWEKEIPDRLNVYRHNTRSNWTDTLDQDFPLTRLQFSEEAWARLRERYFTQHPPAHWELNQSMESFVQFLRNERSAGADRCPPYVKELADYEWHDLKVFIDRSEVKPGRNVTNPTAVVRVYQHQIFLWVEAGAPPSKPARQKPEVLVFYRDSRNTCHIREADPLMLLMLDHYRKPNARLNDLEPVRHQLLPDNQVELETVLASLQKSELIL